jgi:hypothetical protein
MTKYTGTEKQREALLRAIEKWPQVAPCSIPRGRVAHMIIRHDDWCPTVNGGTQLACTCDWEGSLHLQPDDDQQFKRDIEEALDGAE